MTRIEFFSQDDWISGFCGQGHSGYAEEGSDIVCATVTTAISIAANTITDVLGVRAKLKVKDDEAQITLTLPASYEQEEAVQAVLQGMMLTLMSWRDQYPENLEVVMEV